ncbi:MAG: hypothetical protein AB1782_10225 [Cyanobacteriota bacterium]
MIIIGLVSLGAVLILTALGNNITDMFTASNKEIENFDPFDVRNAPSSASHPVTSPDTTYGTPVSTTDIGGTSVTFYDDNSASFNVGSQTVHLAADVIRLQDDVMQTSGASGASNLISAITRMVDAYQTEHPGLEAPVNITFGTGTRSLYGESYTGDVAVNTAVIEVDGHMMIIQNDHGCFENSVGDYCDPAFEDSRIGTYTIEGNMVDGNFTATGIAIDGAALDVTSFAGTLSGSTITGSYEFVTADDDTGCPNCIGSETWNIDLTSAAFTTGI